MKIFEVTFNDGGWHQSLPKFLVIAESKEEAKQKALKENSFYVGWDSWVKELEFDGYVIEVHEKKSYERNKKIECLGI